MLEADEFFDYLAGTPDPTGGGGPPGPAAMAALNAVHDALGLGGGGGDGGSGDSMLHAVEEDAEALQGLLRDGAIPAAWARGAEANGADYCYGGTTCNRNCFARLATWDAPLVASLTAAGLRHKSAPQEACRATAQRPQGHATPG